MDDGSSAGIYKAKNNMYQSITRYSSGRLAISAILLLASMIIVAAPLHSAQASGTEPPLKFAPRPISPPLEIVTVKASALLPASIDSHPIRQPTVWDRIRSANNFFFDPDSRRVRKEMRRYTQSPGYLLKVTERAEPFLHYIVEELDKAGLPTELALLPIIESAYKIDAHSKSGALGLWQFIRPTAKVYGLKRNWWYEGRQDLQDSTRAAIQYFRDLRDMFDGDWLLVLAAYNAGENTVKAAIKRNEKRGKSTEFWDLALPVETMAYVPRFLAVLAIIQNPEAYDIEIWPVPDSPYFIPIDAGGKTRLSALSKEYSVDFNTLHRLNAGLRRKTTPPHGRHTILLPVAESSQTASRDAGGFIRAAFHEPTGISHKVKSGETLSMISRKYGIPVKRIKRNNELRSDHIRIGQKLLIPES